MPILSKYYNIHIMQKTIAPNYYYCCSFCCYKYLPSKIKKLDNFNHFRKEMKLALSNNLFYILEEFLQAKSMQ
jgi:hypothetical protein